MSMFQQQHYEAVAKRMLNLRTSQLVTVTKDTEELWKNTVRELGVMFMVDNPKYKHHVFIKACGMGEI